MMLLKWREREHEEVDSVVERDAGAQLALKRCVLYKFWALKGMRAQVRLLQMFVNYWDLEIGAFNIDGKPLRIEVEDIYFITGFSHRGEVVNVKAWGAIGGIPMEEYISTHCVVGKDKVESQLPIKEIENLSLNIIILVLT
jgi:hypothetical protein